MILLYQWGYTMSEVAIALHSSKSVVRRCLLRNGVQPRPRNTLAARCRRGHPRTEANTYVNPNSGKRWCRQCLRLKHREYRRAAMERQQGWIYPRAARALSGRN